MGWIVNGPRLPEVNAAHGYINTSSGIASRFLAEIHRDPDYWRARVAEAVS